MRKGVLDGPIPGENYTSDTRNYPWHRPAEYDDLDEAMNWAIDKITEPRSAKGLLTLIQAGMTIAQATDIFVTNGIGTGKWTPDYAILLAGPVANTIELLCKAANIKYDMGIEQEEIPSLAYLQTLAELHEFDKNAGLAEEAANEVSDAMNAAPQEPNDNVPKEATGFMGMRGPSTPASSDEQNAMLGEV